MVDDSAVSFNSGAEPVVMTAAIRVPLELHSHQGKSKTAMIRPDDPTVPDNPDPPKSTEGVYRPSYPRAGGRSPAAMPETIGRYRILRKLGEGGMGEVFLAHDDTLSREVALKRIKPGRESRRELRKRFEVEARVTGILQHPSIVPVYDFFEEGDEAFYTMRPIDGITLAKLIGQLREPGSQKRDDWPTARLARLFLQAANAVAFAHSHGVIHRDLKPSNIMIGPFEQVVVLDWGMAKTRIDGPDTEARPASNRFPALTLDTASRSLVGTPPYMSPEQLSYEAATFRSDVYSLGIILYELLTLRLPWNSDTLDGLREARKEPPQPHSLLQPSHGIATEMDDVVLRALAHDPDERFASVRDLSREAARVLEGRPRWYLEPSSTDPGSWRQADLSLKQQGDERFLQTGSTKKRFQYLCTARFADNLRFEFEFNVSRGSHVLSACLNNQETRGRPGSTGYQLDVLPGKRRTLSFLRSGRIVNGARSPRYEPRRWYRCTVIREDDRISLQIDGVELYVYHDPIPLTGGLVGLRGRTPGLRLRKVKVSTRSAGAMVSCLAVPDAFFNHGLYEKARVEYERIAASHPGRNEGRLAGFRAGLCPLEMAENESDEELRQLLLDESHSVFSGLVGANRSSLSYLGLAMVAEEKGDWDDNFRALRSALETYPEDPNRSTVQEWILGRLHDVDLERDRRTLAELLPLAIPHCMGNLWSRRVLLDLIKKIRRDWEIPSFMNSRSVVRERDAVSHQEARLFFGFWAGKTELIDRVISGLADQGSLRPHHLADSVCCLLELGYPDRAQDLFERIEGKFSRGAEPKVLNVREFCRTTIAAAKGDLDRSERHFSGLDPALSIRIYNSARRWLAVGLFDAGETGRAMRALRIMDPRDGFSREQQAWLYLHMGDARRADKLLEFFLRRNDHLNGRNLANFLHGVSLTLQGREDAAQRTFSRLPAYPFPRTWTLGSHYATGRLGDGDLRAYLDNSFTWERNQLQSQIKLLKLARGESGNEDSIEN